jgi:hypothetical protein
MGSFLAELAAGNSGAGRVTQSGTVERSALVTSEDAGSNPSWTRSLCDRGKTIFDSVGFLRGLRFPPT